MMHTENDNYHPINMANLFTFFEKMFCSENPHVATKAETRPNISKDISVMVAMATPRIIGTNEKYTCTGKEEKILSVKQEAD